nr:MULTISPECIES: glycosyltransferase [Halorhodospira]
MHCAGPEGDSPKVTCITVFYNRASGVAQTINSLLNQTYRNLDIIIVDDGSTDSTLKEINRLAVESRIRVIAKENSGFTRSMIRAIEASDGEYIAIQGAGDESHPERIACQVRYLKEHPEVGAVGCWRDSENLETGTRSVQRRTEYVPVGGLLAATRNPFSQGEVTMCRAAYLEAGGYRSFFRFRQDYDLWLRMNEGYSLAVVPRVLYKEYGWKGGLRNDPSSMVLAAGLARLAKVAALSRRREGVDPIDADPEAAFDLLVGDKEYARRLKGLAFFAALRFGGRTGVMVIDEALRVVPKWDSRVLRWFFIAGERGDFLRRIGAAMNAVRIKVRSAG